MPKTKVEFNEIEIKQILREEIRKKHKLKKHVEIKIELYIDRREDDTPVVSCGALFSDEE